MLLTSLSARLCAQEVVIYWQKPKPAAESTIFSAPIEAVRGVLNAMDDKAIFYTPPGAKQPSKILSDQVVGIRMVWTDAKVAEANAAFRSGDFKEAINRYLALLDKPAGGAWQQKLLMLQITSATEFMERQAMATKVFAQAHASGLPGFCYAYTPLVWTNDPVAPEILAELEKEYGDKKNSLIQLITGSWGLMSNNRQTAVITLESLAKKQEEPLSSLAKAQLWRAVPPQKFVSEGLDDALKFRDQLPLSLQAGPTAIIANQFERAGDYDAAFDYWTEVAIASKYAQLSIFSVSTRHLDDIANRQGRVDQWNKLKEILKSE